MRDQEPAQVTDHRANTKNPRLHKTLCCGRNNDHPRACLSIDSSSDCPCHRRNTHYCAGCAKRVDYEEVRHIGEKALAYEGMYLPERYDANNVP